ncbi:MAG: bifunctional hydroxymethylpyrimidine kinase/phosphomethylpyrimidine kinase, partial [Clostridia bacterium]|nr:bifunctional hydroxymethylpyrimidine kinase/phosphomethylpyrimidine kinase [Clostridia bacterium]
QIVIADTKLPNFRFLTLEDVRDSLPLIDYITPNEDEARYFTGKEDPEEMAEVLLEYGVRNVIVKLGSKGCFFRSGDKKIRLEAFPIDAVDATGAGDNFVAGFCSELLRGSEAEIALRFASACGAICTTAVGAGTALRNREQVMEFLKKNEIP